MVTAIILIDVESAHISQAAQAIADLPGVDQVYSCAGDVDLIAVTQCRNHEDLTELIPNGIAKVPGVIKTVTHIAFRSYSHADTDAAFSIGLE